MVLSFPSTLNTKETDMHALEVLGPALEVEEEEVEREREEEEDVRSCLLLRSC